MTRVSPAWMPSDRSACGAGGPGSIGALTSPPIGRRQSGPKPVAPIHREATSPSPIEVVRVYATPAAVPAEIQQLRSDADFVRADPGAPDLGRGPASATPDRGCCRHAQTAGWDQGAIAGTCCVSAPVWWPNGACAGAVTVTVHAHDLLVGLPTLVSHAACRIGAALQQLKPK